MTRMTSYWHFFVTAASALLVASQHYTSAQVFTGDGTAYTLKETMSGNCNMMAANSDAGDNYAALNNDQWAGSKNCGRCALVSCADDRCADKSISQVVQILDRCPECKSGDLDLSPSVFKKITGLNSLSRYTIKWQFVDCPISGNIKYCLKTGSNPFFVAIQPTNTGAGVASMEINSKPVTMVDSAYYFLLDGHGKDKVDLGAVKITLTSLDKQKITETMALQPGSCTEGKLQFASVAAAVNADADAAVMLQVGNAQSTTNRTQQPSQNQAASAPPMANAAITTATNTPTPPATTAPIPVYDSPSSSTPVVTTASTPAALVPAPAPAPPSVITPVTAQAPVPATPVSVPAPVSAPAPAPVAAPHPAVHRCKVKSSKHKDH